MASTVRQVAPAELRLPSSSFSGSDPYKLHRQIQSFGTSIDGMPPVLVYEGSDGFLEIYDGVTRATRIAKFAPGVEIVVEIIGKLRQPRANYPRVGDRI
jgi:hypothetical protein